MIPTRRNAITIAMVKEEFFIDSREVDIVYIIPYSMELCKLLESLYAGLFLPHFTVSPVQWFQPSIQGSGVM